MSSVRENTPQRVSKMFFFSQIYTEEQNTQHSTETLSQPISQNVTANLSWKASVTSVCRRRSVGSKCAPKTSVNSVRSVREKSPQRVVCVLSHREGAFYFSQIYTEEQNTQHSTETLSQPISQNLTATFSWNVLWYLYAEGVLWNRNSAQKCSVKSVSSVREKNVLCERKNSPTNLKRSFPHGGCVLFLTELHRRTEHTKAHRDVKSTDFTEPYSQQNTHSHPRSFQEHALLHSRTCPSTSKNTPFLMLDKALL